MADIPHVLFVCTHNAGRSQMAAALLDHQAAGRVRVTSAGSQPADQLNPAVTIGRTLTDTYAGIAPASAPAFIAAQLVGGAIGALLAVVIYPARPRGARAEPPVQLAG